MLFTNKQIFLPILLAVLFDIVLCNVLCNIGNHFVHIAHIEQVSIYCTYSTKFYEIVHEIVMVWFADVDRHSHRGGRGRTRRVVWWPAGGPARVHTAGVTPEVLPLSLPVAAMSVTRRNDSHVRLGAGNQ